MTIVTFGQYSFDTDDLRGRGFLTPYAVNGVTYELETAMRVAAALDMSGKSAVATTAADEAVRQANAAHADRVAADAASALAATKAGEAAASALTAYSLARLPQPSEIAGIPPILDFTFSGPAAVPSGVVTGSSGKWVMGQNGLLTFVPAGTAPIDYDPGTGALRGLLVEEARTTLMVKSRRLDDPSWAKSGITAGAISGADGVLAAATRLTATAANGTCIQSSSSASAARRFAPYVRRASGTGAVQMTLDGGTTWTTIVPTSAYTRYGIGQTTANPTVGFRVGSVGDQIDVDFASGETGAFDTSPIESGSSLVTRSADVNSLLLSSVPGWVANEGTVYVEAMTLASGVGAFRTAVQLYSSNSSYVQVLQNYLGQPSAVVSDAGVQQCNVADTVTPFSQMTKLAFAWSPGNFALACNGRAAVTSGTGTLPALTSLAIGATSAGQALGYWNGHIPRVMLSPRRWTNTTLQLLTA